MYKTPQQIHSLFSKWSQEKRAGILTNEEVNTKMRNLMLILMQLILKVKYLIVLLLLVLLGKKMTG